MSKYVLAIDQGTTSSRAILFDKSGNIISSAQQEFTQYFPKAGWVEHDPIEIWETQSEMVKAAIAKANASPEEVAAIGITNQRETVVVWDRTTGKPIYNAIVWQDKSVQQRKTIAFVTKGLSKTATHLAKLFMKFGDWGFRLYP